MDPKERAVQIMQKLKLGEVDCLVMYDNGANANMIHGSVASLLDLQSVDQSPVVMTGIADMKLSSHGTYKLILGLT